MSPVRHGVLALCLAALLPACRGGTSTEPPILYPTKMIELLLPITSMNYQPKYHPQGQNEFWADGRDARLPPAGTVARGHLHPDTTFFTGVMPSGEPAVGYPMPVDRPLLEKGQRRFNTFCSPCHDRTGSGHGLVPRRGWIPPPTFHQDSLRAYTPGQFFSVITHGIRTMPSYAKQIPEADRWAIVSWVQVLQRSQFGRLEDVPAAQRSQLK